MSYHINLIVNSSLAPFDFYYRSHLSGHQYLFQSDLLLEVNNLCCYT